MMMLITCIIVVAATALVISIAVVLKDFEAERAREKEAKENKRKQEKEKAIFEMLNNMNVEDLATLRNKLAIMHLSGRQRMAYDMLNTLIKGPIEDEKPKHMKRES